MCRYSPIYKNVLSIQILSKVLFPILCSVWKYYEVIFHSPHLVFKTTLRYKQHVIILLFQNLREVEQFSRASLQLRSGKLVLEPRLKTTQPSLLLPKLQQFDVMACISILLKTLKICLMRVLKKNIKQGEKILFSFFDYTSNLIFCFLAVSFLNCLFFFPLFYWQQ